MRKSLAIFALILITCTASAAEYHVSPSGNDSEDGSISSPWLTLQHAIETATWGDTVKVATGTYEPIALGTNLDTFNGDITAKFDGTEQYLVFEPEDGASPVISSGSQTNAISMGNKQSTYYDARFRFKGFEILGAVYVPSTVGLQIIDSNIIGNDTLQVTSAGVYVNRTSNLTLSNCTIHHFLKNVNSGPANWMTVSGCNITGAGEDGMEINGNHILIENNKIHDNEPLGDGGHPDAISFWGSAPNVIVRGNRLYNLNNTQGLFAGSAFDQDNILIENNYIDNRTGYCGICMDRLTNSIIRNNTLSGIRLRNLSGTPTLVSNVEIYNNIIFGGLALQDVPTNAIAHHSNNIYSTSELPLAEGDYDYSSLEELYNAVFEGSTPPSDGTDYTPEIKQDTGQGLARDAGISNTSHPAAPTDITGQDRNDSFPDIGAFEFKETGPTCTNGQTQQCGTTNTGECSYGTQTCSNGSWGTCVGAVYPTTEICTGNLDEDCDGQTDCQDTDCTSNPSCTTPSDYDIHIDFEAGNNGTWADYNPGQGTPAWAIVNDSANGGTNALQLGGTINMAVNQNTLGAYRLLQGTTAENFTLEAKIRSTSTSQWRDLGIIFSYQDQNNHCMIIFNSYCDYATNGIFVTDGAEKLKLGTECQTEGPNLGEMPDNQWHDVKITKQEQNIQVFFDDMQTAVFTTITGECGTGIFGFGSINDTALFDDIGITIGQECVNMTSLTSYLAQWKAGNTSIVTIMQKISAWKAGTGC